MTYFVTRQISIDAGHRVPEHGSKCRNLHGHRYVIDATCVARGGLIQEGEQRDMVLDFGFLKTIMLEEIDLFCDHGMILRVDDPWLTYFLTGDKAREVVDDSVRDLGCCWLVKGGLSTMGKVYIVPFSPTAERLAEHWFKRMEDRVHESSKGHARLTTVKVHETPNCVALYTPHLRGLEKGV